MLWIALWAAPALAGSPRVAAKAPVSFAAPLTNAAPLPFPGLAPPPGAATVQAARWDAAFHAVAAPLKPAESLQPLEPLAQIAASGLYRGPGAALAWGEERDPRLRWLSFYRSLYEELSRLPPGHPFRSETDAGPVFFVGGHDVAQALLGLPRSHPDTSVNLHARLPENPEPEDLMRVWTRVKIAALGGGTASVGLDPEATLSLDLMARRGRDSAGEALDAVQDNILLKWNLLALTPDGAELRALDERAASDLRARVLRLSLNRGLLNAYELHYNLIVAYRAVKEAPSPWTLDRGTARLLADSVLALPAPRLAEAFGRALKPFATASRDKRQAALRLLDFAGEQLGASAREALRKAAEALPEKDGGLLPGKGRPPRDDRQRAKSLASRWRTEEQLHRLAREPRAPAETFRFNVIGDAEPGRFWFSRLLFNVPGVFGRLLVRADRDAVDFTVQLGDMVSLGTARNYLRFFQLLERLKPSRPLLTVIGNHDRRSPHGVSDSALYQALFGPTDYFFDRGGWRFIVLDSSAQRVTDAQLRWLDNALDTPLRKIVFTHVPPAPLARWTDFAGAKGVGGFKKGGEAFTQIVARRGVARVYVGHIHAFGVLLHRGVQYVLTGGGGSALFPTTAGSKFHHFLTVEAGPDGLRETVHRADGVSFPLPDPE